MNRRSFLNLAACASFGTALGRARAQPPQTEPFLGAWLHLQEVFRNRDSRADREAALDDVLEGHLAAGLRTVIPFVTNTSGTAEFPSLVMKQRPDDDWDPLEYLISRAQQRGLEVCPAFCVLVSGHDTPSGVLIDRPEWASRHPDGTPMGHICPAHPDARGWVTSVISDVVKRYPTKSIMLDYLRYYNRPHRLDVASERAFAAWKTNRQEIPEEDAFQEFREAEISRLARQISDTTRQINPELKIAIYSWGPHVASDHLVAQPWPSWSRDRIIDQVSVSGYCYPDNYGANYLDVFSRRIGDAVELNRRNEGHARMTFSLGVKTSHGRIREASWINDYLTRAADQDVAGVEVFTWTSLQPHLEETIRQGYFSEFRKRVAASG